MSVKLGYGVVGILSAQLIQIDLIFVDGKPE